MKRLSICLVCGGMLVSLAAHAQTQSTETLIISGPIVPSTKVLYAHTGANYPATQQDREQVAQEAALSFPFLLDACVDYPKITHWSPGQPELTSEQLTTNYDEVARCSYEQFLAKPYWIPQLVNDVDICGLVLGSQWHLITEADVLSFTESDFQFLQDTLSTPLGQSSWGSLYFSLNVFVRGNDGSIKQANLQLGVAERIKPGPTGTLPYEGALALRCILRISR